MSDVVRVGGGDPFGGVASFSGDDVMGVSCCDDDVVMGVSCEVVRGGGCEDVSVGVVWWALTGVVSTGSAMNGNSLYTHNTVNVTVQYKYNVYWYRLAHGCNQNTLTTAAHGRSLKDGDQRSLKEQHNVCTMLCG